MSTVPPSASASCSGLLVLVTTIEPIIPAGITSSATARPPPKIVAGMVGDNRVALNVGEVKSGTNPRIATKRPPPGAGPNQNPGNEARASAAFVSASRPGSGAVLNT